MPDNLMLLVFLAGHLLGDYYFQPHQLAEEKNHSFSRLLQHSLIYLGGMLLAGLLYISLPLLVFLLAAGVLHFLIDGLKWYGHLLHRRYRPRYPVSETNVKSLLFLTDQLLHFLSLVLLTALAKEAGLQVGGDSLLQRLFQSVFGLEDGLVFRALFLALLLGKPVNIALSLLFRRYRPVEQEEGSVPNAGGWIGTLERWMVSILVALGQYAALAFVITAKSVARYSKINEDPAFAEYYLIGTLASCLAALAATRLVL